MERTGLGGGEGNAGEHKQLLTGLTVRASREIGDGWWGIKGQGDRIR